MRRMTEYRDILDDKLAYLNTTISYLFRGGAHLNFVEDHSAQARGFDILIVMVGGNDLASGASSTYFRACYHRIVVSALNLGVKSVIFPSIWPRQSVEFNRRARQHSVWMNEQYDQHPLVIFWQWDRRKPSQTYDSVHLNPKILTKNKKIE